MTDHHTLSQAVIFLRGRHGNVADQRQLAAERDTCYRAATHLGLVVIREYVEHGGTGQIQRRPGLRLLLEELRALRDAGYVVVTRLDHLARTQTDRRASELELEAAGARLIVASELLATRTGQEEITV